MMLAVKLSKSAFERSYWGNPIMWLIAVCWTMSPPSRGRVPDTYRATRRYLAADTE